MSTIASLVAEFGAKDRGFESYARRVAASLESIDNKLGKTNTSLNRTMTKGSATFGMLEKKIGTVSGLAKTATFAFVALAGALSYGFYKVVQAGASFDAAVVNLQSALQRAGVRDIPTVTAALEAYAGQLQLTSRYSDDAILSAQAYGLSLGVPVAKIKEVTTAAADFATRTHVSLEAALGGMAKAAAGQAEILQRAGIRIDQTRLKAEGLDYVVQLLNEHFAGATQASVENAEGRWIRLGNAMGDVEKEGGRLVTSNKLVNAFLQQLGTEFENLSIYIERNETTLAAYVNVGLQKFFGAVRLGIQVLGFFGQAWAALTEMGNLALYSITEIAGKIVGTAAQVVGTIAQIMGTVQLLNKVMPSGVIGTVMDKLFGSHTQKDIEDTVTGVGDFATKLGDIASQLAGDDGLSSMFMQSALEANQTFDRIGNGVDKVIGKFDKFIIVVDKLSHKIRTIPTPKPDVPTINQGYASTYYTPFSNTSGLIPNSAYATNPSAALGLAGKLAGPNIGGFMLDAKIQALLSGQPMASKMELAFNHFLSKLKNEFNDLPPMLKGALDVGSSAVLGASPNLNTLVSGAQQGLEATGGNPLGAAAGAITAMITSSATFATLMDQVNSLLQDVFDTVGQVLQPLLPLFHLLADEIRPFLAILSPIVRILSMANSAFIMLNLSLHILLPVLQILFNAIKAVAVGILKAIQSVAKLLHIHIGPVDEALKSLADTTWDSANATKKMGDAAAAANDALTNLPDGFKYALRKFQAEDATATNAPGGGNSSGPVDTSPTDAGAPGAAGSQATPTSTSNAATSADASSSGGVHYHIGNLVLHGITDVAALEAELERRAGRKNTIRFGTLVPMKG